MAMNNQQKDLYQEITDKIIAELEQGRLPGANLGIPATRLHCRPAC